MAKSSLTSQISKVDAVITLGNLTDENIKAAVQRLALALPTYASTYGAILHDKDVDADGKLKTPHIHVVMTLPHRKRKSTIINDLADLCGVGTLAVSVDKCASFDAAFQYLIHLKNKDKYQYSIEDVFTNFDEGEIDLLLSQDAETIDVHYIYSICLTSENIIQVMESVGLGTFQHYRATILDIWNYAIEIKKEKHKDV